MQGALELLIVLLIGFLIFNGGMNERPPPDDQPNVEERSIRYRKITALRDDPRRNREKWRV
jgi:hypothetical protein